MTDNVENYDEELLIDLDKIMGEATPPNESVSSVFAEKAKESLNYIKETLACSNSFINIIKESIPQETFQAILTSEQQLKLATGALKLMQRKDGQMLASLVNPATGKIASSVALEKVADYTNLSNNITNFAIQRQLAEISHKLELICDALEELRQGQERDRLSAVTSCERNFINAIRLKDPNNKRQALVAVTQACETSRNALMESQKANIKFIESRPSTYLGKTLAFKQNLKEIDKRIEEIRNSLQAIRIASLTEALAFQEMNEIESRNGSLIWFSNFIKTTYLDNENLIQRLDLLDSVDNYWSNTLPSIVIEIDKISAAANNLIEE